MTSNDLMETIKAQGITLLVVDGRLRISAPKGILTSDTRAMLLHRKAELIAWHNARAREDLDHYFAEVILPKLSELHQAGKLPNLAYDPLWTQVEAEWDKASVHSADPCDVEVVKKLMDTAVCQWKRA